MYQPSVLLPSNTRMVQAGRPALPLVLMVTFVVAGGASGYSGLYFTEIACNVPAIKTEESCELVAEPSLPAARPELNGPTIWTMDHSAFFERRLDRADGLSSFTVSSAGVSVVTASLATFRSAVPRVPAS